MHQERPPVATILGKGLRRANQQRCKGATQRGDAFKVVDDAGEGTDIPVPIARQIAQKPQLEEEPASHQERDSYSPLQVGTKLLPDNGPEHRVHETPLAVSRAVVSSRKKRRSPRLPR
jgi:hypothetical protein